MVPDIAHHVRHMCSTVATCLINLELYNCSIFPVGISGLTMLLCELHIDIIFVLEQCTVHSSLFIATMYILQLFCNLHVLHDNPFFLNAK